MSRVQVIQQAEATAARRRLWLELVQNGDGFTPLTGEAGKAKISKAGAAPADSVNNIVEVSSANTPGLYYVELDPATEINSLGWGAAHYKVAGSRVARAFFATVPYDPFAIDKTGFVQDPADKTGYTLDPADKDGMILDASGMDAIPGYVP